jgi:hypothetical protein
VNAIVHEISKEARLDVDWVEGASAIERIFERWAVGANVCARERLRFGLKVVREVGQVVVVVIRMRPTRLWAGLVAEASESGLASKRELVGRERVEKMR